MLLDAPRGFYSFSGPFPTPVPFPSGQFGISLSSPANPKNATEFGLHYQKNIFFNGDMAIDWGVHDIVWYQGGYTNDGLNTNNVSIFAVLSNQKISKHIIS